MPESHPDPAPLPLLLVGCGGIAQAYLQALAHTEELDCVAAVDPDPGAQERFRMQQGKPAYASVPAALAAAPQARAALVLAPPDQHETLSVALLTAGLHVLCEKPLAPTLAAAQRMLATARAAGRLLMLGSKFRYTADVLAARQLLDAGFCGELVLYENVFCSHVAMARRWHADPARSGGGVLIDNGCHSVDLARYLLGPIRRIQASFGRPAQHLAVEDTARVLFESHCGALGLIDLSWSVHQETPSYVRLHGSRGTIEIGWRESRCKQVTDTTWQVIGRGYDKVAAFAAQLQNFAGVILRQETPRLDADDALAAVEAIETAYRSQREERWLSLPPANPSPQPSR
jgi:predicted dehydrogenase